MDKNGNTLEIKIDRLIYLAENIFILECLKTGVKVEDTRKLVKTDKVRVNNISKTLSSAKREARLK